MLVIAMVVFCNLLCAQDSATQSSTKLLESRLQAAESSTDLNDQTRAFVVDKYKQALSELETLKTLQTEADIFVAYTKNAPDLVRSLKGQLKSPSEDPSIDRTLADSVETAESMLAEQQTTLDNARRELGILEDDKLHLPEQRGEVPKMIAASETLIETLRREASETPEIELPIGFTDAPKRLRAIKLQGCSIANQDCKSKACIS